MSSGTEWILGSIVSGFGCVSKLGLYATFLGYMRRFGVDVKVDLERNLIHTHYLILHFNLLFSLDPLLLVHVI